MKYLLVSILFLSGCQMYQPKIPLMAGEAQAARLISCASLNLDHQIVFNDKHQVIDITCVPRYGYSYDVIKLKEVPVTKPVEEKK